MTRIEAAFAEAVAAHQATVRQSADAIGLAADAMRASLARGAKIVVFGNGGSAADSQHVAAELINRFQVERRAFAALALTTDTSILTSVANDSSYDRVFARQIEGLGRAGDVALGISTSGRSRSVIAAFEQARLQGLTTIALIGSHRASVDHLADFCITVPVASTARVQEVHRTILHVLCELIEC
ncbi:MAG TPA: SIS domain-containing protein [Vicinamibacterales bacterium]|nr:SIS domain-containing protein [Vicinamibacterales bacterium]